MMTVPSDDEGFFEQIARRTELPDEELPDDLAPDRLKFQLRSALEACQEETSMFDVLAACESAEHAPASLKSRIYSTLVQKQESDGALLPLPLVKQAGGKLCVFEDLVSIAPVGRALHSGNYCRVCHARVLAEHLDHAPIWWPGCPYVQFQGR